MRVDAIVDPSTPELDPTVSGRASTRSRPISAIRVPRVAVLPVEGPLRWDGRRSADGVARRPLALVFNGEIYNYVELRQELERQHGVRFRTNGDTEVLLHALIRWGDDAFNRLNGMWG